MNLIKGKKPGNCRWCWCREPFRTDQVRKHPKNAPGGQVLSPTRYEIGGKVRLVVVLKEWGFCQAPHPKHFTNSLPSLPEAPGTKTPPKRAWWACFRPHQVRKIPKSAPGGQVYGQSRRKITCLSPKTPLFEDELTKNLSSSTTTAPNVDGSTKRTSGAGAKGKTRQIPMFPVAMCPGNPGYD